MSFENPQSDADFSKIEKQHLGAAEAARSQVHEEIYSALNPTQKEMLSRIDDIALEKDGNGGVVIRVTADIDGSDHSLFMMKDSRESCLAKIDDLEVSDQEKAKNLFDFYLPIAELHEEERHYPTERSQHVELEMLTEKFLGK